MPKTKEQKHKAIESGSDSLLKSETVILVDFTGLSVNKLNAFRRAVKEMGGVFQLIKKRLLKFVFEKAGLEFNPKAFAGQTGVLFSPEGLQETASVVYKFGKTADKAMKILGGFNVKDKTFIESANVIRFGSLPSREVLLSQLMGMLGTPIKMLMHVLNEKGRKS
ncbi:MAG: 50S ribosomal protein L10 [Candidatus Jorgensenbacteria bacterium GW2011_GWA1_48_13]|uniref:Large ribosomal subunit protein uL10 n=2 Tax=Candidatus Joergenseniibacteriota TaxID=1752739 RepID=A0A0G1Z837_9BACT|nr:MAG: 50S ribosomal protein L10 [Candidatus Jorgensenbacteria bacterium GW2011_GWA1_48_13]KKU98644.1 MAG: 50S ribosomal protein L10 [Candidatus Jorgensenbacteria bacterium GW2011_GWC1_48_8]KKW15124.1 MAG: 50S ribosomal protein L10 [Candidatus Jorgensenbacteria bacterium GW2011_GWB1_50_10]